MVGRARDDSWRLRAFTGAIPLVTPMLQQRFGRASATTSATSQLYAITKLGGSCPVKQGVGEKGHPGDDSRLVAQRLRFRLSRRGQCVSSRNLSLKPWTFSPIKGRSLSRRDGEPVPAGKVGKTFPLSLWLVIPPLLGAFTSEEIGLCSYLAPHLETAARILQRIVDLEAIVTAPSLRDGHPNAG